jgi:1,4-alpha-glucan branching enzyme
VQQSVLCFQRKHGHSHLIVVLNFTPMVREDYHIGVPQNGVYREIFNSDSHYYAGTNTGNGNVQTTDEPWMNQTHSLKLTLPPLGAIILKI